MTLDINIHTNTLYLMTDNDPRVCPIGLELMEDPVLASDGHSYDRCHILKWFSVSKTSPVTNMPINTRLFDNIALRGSNYKPYIPTKQNKKRNRRRRYRRNADIV